MTYREVRSCVEMLRKIEYPDQLSMEDFRGSNFPLIASIMLNLAKRFDSEAEFPKGMSTEDERVAFVRHIAEFIAVKANVRLNTKRLYQADGYAVKEILKIASPFYHAWQTMVIDETKDHHAEENSLMGKKFEIANKLNNLEQSRQLAVEVTTSGSSLFDLLRKEIRVRATRQAISSKKFEIGELREQFTQATVLIRAEIDETNEQINNITATEANLDGKIERREVEIDRNERRLLSIRKVRPIFFEDFTKFETELNSLFSGYSSRMRCLVLLQKSAAEAERAQAQREKNSSLPRPVPTNIALDTVEEDLRVDEPIEQSVSLLQSQLIDRIGPPSRLERPRARTGLRTRLDFQRAEDAAKAKGAGQPGFSSTSSLEITSDSEDDELFMEGDDTDDDDSLALEFSEREVNKRAPSSRHTSNKFHFDNSDDDF